MSGFIGSLTDWLNLLRYFLIKDIKSKYAGSGLGILWSFILPIFQIAIYWFVFSQVMRARPYSNAHIPYIFFLLSGFFFWAAFSEGIIRAGSCTIENSELVKKVPFNNSVLPVAVTLSSYLHNLIGVVIFVIILAVSGYFQFKILLILPVLLLQILFSIGSGLLIASIVPYIRDLQQITGYALQGMFFVSPIIYSLDSIPERFRTLVYLNPITVYIDSYHKIILEGVFPDLLSVAVMTAIAVFSMLTGIKVFNKLKEGFSDIL